MPPHGDGDELCSFPASIPHSTQLDLPKTPADTTSIDYYYSDYCTFDDSGYFPMPSPQIDFSEINNFSAPADGPEDDRRCSTNNADMRGGGGHAHAAAPCRARAPCAQLGPGSNHHIVDREKMKIQQLLHSFKSAIEKDLITQKIKRFPLGSYFTYFLLMYCSMSYGHSRLQGCGFPPEHCDISTETPCSIVRFNPDSKDRKTRQGCWKEKGMAGMRPEPSSLLPGQQGYVGLKKTLELHGGGGTAGKWRAHEYTPLLPSEDGTKLVPAEISLRIVFKHDKPSSSSKRPRTTDDDRPKNGPRKSSHVWEHMTKVHAKVTTTNDADGPQRKNNPYRVMYAICNHCDKVFKADPKNGTSTPSNHLDSCNCNCPRTRDPFTFRWYDEGSVTGHTAQREQHATGTQQAEAMEAGPRGGPSHHKPNVRMSWEEWA